MVAAGGRASDTGAVHQQFDLVGVGVHLHRDRVPLVARPGPRLDGIAERPGALVERCLPVALGRLHRERRTGGEAEHDLAPVRDRATEAGDVEVAAVCRQRRVGTHEGHRDRVTRRRVVGDAADAGLAEVVPTHPGEVADHVGERLHQLPPLRDDRRPVLRAEDHALREEFAVHLVARLAVVVARDVEVRVRLRSLRAHDLLL